MKVRLIMQFVLIFLFAVCVEGQETHRASSMRARLYEPMIAAAAARHKVDPHLLWTIAYLESRFRPEAISYKNGKPCARGLMQLVAATAQRYGVKNPHNSEESVDAAARYVRDLHARFGDHYDLVLAAYNSGEGTVEAFRIGKTLVLPDGKVINRKAIRTDGVPPYRETREYVARGRLIYEQISGIRLLRPHTPIPAAVLRLTPKLIQAERSLYSFDEMRYLKRTAPSNSASLYPH